MLAGNALAVADPSADNLNWESFGKLRLPADSTVHEQLGPRRQSGLADDAE